MTQQATDAGSRIIPAGNLAAIRHFERAVTDGEHWYIAMLEAIGLCDTAEETCDGRTYRYLIDGEAFDWLLLAERLCQTANGLIPADEKAALLFAGKPPLNVPPEKFRKLIGSAKYHQYLNYFYGVIVEEALIAAVEQEVRKESWISGYLKDKDTTNETYRRIYGATRAVLLRRFRREKGNPQLRSITLSELKEFTYWLFKFRIKNCDKAKIASDTKKALQQLHPTSPTGKSSLAEDSAANEVLTT